MEKRSSSCSFLFSDNNTHLFIASNVCSDALPSSSSIAKPNNNINAPPPTVETQEIDLTPHYPQNPASPPEASTSSSSGVPTIVTQGGSSEFSNATSADDDKIQGIPSCSSSVPVPRNEKANLIIKAAELIVEASIMCCDQIDSSKFIRVSLEQLLPRDIKKPRKMRLFITARDKDVRQRCRIKTHALAIRCLPNTEATSLLRNEMYDETNGAEDQMNSSPIKQDSEDMWWNSKSFHCANNSHMFRKRQTESFSYSNGRERQMECYLFTHHFPEIAKDPFLDICSFLNKKSTCHKRHKYHCKCI